jgi:hypothetical protein
MYPSMWFPVVLADKEIMFPVVEPFGGATVAAPEGVRSQARRHPPTPPRGRR